jgi:hypothetical protein
VKKLSYLIKEIKVPSVLVVMVVVHVRIAGCGVVW